MSVDLNTLTTGTFRRIRPFLSDSGGPCGDVGDVGQPEHDQHVIQMNEVHGRASGWVQRAAPKVAA
jgi:hypothetical protein